MAANEKYHSIHLSVIAERFDDAVIESKVYHSCFLLVFSEGFIRDYSSELEPPRPSSSVLSYLNIST